MQKQIKLAAQGATRRILWAVVALAAMWTLPAQAQVLTPGQLDNLVSRIALYREPLTRRPAASPSQYHETHAVQPNRSDRVERKAPERHEEHRNERREERK